MFTSRCLALASKQRPCFALLGGRSHNNANLAPSLTPYRWKHVKSNTTVERGEVKPLKRKKKPSQKRFLPRSQPNNEQASSGTPASSLSTLKLSQLQDLARTLGISQTAPKSALKARLVDTLTAHSSLPPTSRILSIDLGIRNLAYALLTPPAASSSLPSKPIPHPTVHAWNRIDLRSLSSTSVSGGGGGGGGTKADFSPPALSALALELVMSHLLPLKPTHVLIEKQRFRSGGGSAVLEWTVRVNSLESMLYAIFATLGALGQFEGRVIPVDPRRVGPFLLEDEEGVMKVEEGRRNGKEEDEDEKKKKKKKVVGKENKKLKIDLVGGWIRDGRGLQFVGEGEVMRRAFLRRWLPREKRGKQEKKGDGEEVVEVLEESEVEEEMIPKLDDVADCLLQGVAWLRWEENKRRHAREMVGKL